MEREEAPFFVILGRQVIQLFIHILGRRPCFIQFRQQRFFLGAGLRVFCVNLIQALDRHFHVVNRFFPARNHLAGVFHGFRHAGVLFKTHNIHAIKPKFPHQSRFRHIEIVNVREPLTCFEHPPVSDGRNNNRRQYKNPHYQIQLNTQFQVFHFPLPFHVPCTIFLYANGKNPTKTF